MSQLIAESSSSNLCNTIRAPVNLSLRLIATKESSTRRGRCYSGFRLNLNTSLKAIEKRMKMMMKACR